MVAVFVEHFLDEEGDAYLRDWVIEAQSTLSEEEGFLSLSLQEEHLDFPRSILVFKFETLGHVEAWIKSENHALLQQKLGLYSLGKQQTSIFEVKRT